MPIFWSVRRMVSQSENHSSGQHHIQNGSITAGLLLQQRQGASALSASTASIPASRRFSAIISRMLASILYITP